MAIHTEIGADERISKTSRAGFLHMRPSFKTTAILLELLVIIILVGWLYSEYMSNPLMRQYINSFLQGTQTGRLLQQLVGIGNVLVLPLRLISLFLISVVSMILMLLLLFMFTTFLASLIAGRRRTKMRR